MEVFAEDAPSTASDLIYHVPISGISPQADLYILRQLEKTFLQPEEEKNIVPPGYNNNNFETHV